MEPSQLQSAEPAAHSAVILGASSALAQAVARILVDKGQSLVLVGRDAEKLDVIAADLKVRAGDTVSVQTRIVDLADSDKHQELIDSTSDAESYWLFYGSLPDQQACEASWQDTEAAFTVNFTSAASLLGRIANVFEARKRGSVVVVSSVAGDRGRQSNYVYGASKGALSLFCQGLRSRLQKSDVQLLTVKPGFIDTPMTADVPKTPGVLWVSPDRVAQDMVRAQSRGKDVLYTPWFWLPIMLIIRLIPERIFKRLSL